MSFRGEGLASDLTKKISTNGVQTTAGALKNEHPFFHFFQTLQQRVFNFFNETRFCVAMILIFDEKYKLY